MTTPHQAQQAETAATESPETQQFVALLAAAEADAARLARLVGRELRAGDRAALVTQLRYLASLIDAHTSCTLVRSRPVEVGLEVSRRISRRMTGPAARVISASKWARVTGLRHVRPIFGGYYRNPCISQPTVPYIIVYTCWCEQ
jgi:hypothetical protein